MSFVSSNEPLALFFGFCFFGLIYTQASLHEYGKDKVYIKNVKGFIKLSLQYGYRILPSYSFGECNTYRNLLSSDNAFTRWLSRKQIPAVLPWGQWWFPLLPISSGGVHNIVSYGKKLPQIENPTQEDIDKWHAWYVDELKGLFDRNKWRFGMDDKELIIL